MKLVYDLSRSYLSIIGPLALTIIILPNASKTITAGWFRSVMAVYSMPILWTIFLKIGNLFLGKSLAKINDVIAQSSGAGTAVIVFNQAGFVFIVIVTLIISAILTLAILFSYKTANSFYTGIFAASGANVGPGILNAVSMGLFKKG